MYERHPSPMQSGPTETRPFHSAQEAMPPVKVTQIESAITRLASLCNSLTAKTEALGDRLHPVLRGDVPVPGGPPEVRESAPSTPLAIELTDIAAKIEMSLRRLELIEQRLEL